ncbi:stage V sporulation protein D [Candidatus Termititenax persephonae]|uniref:Stage V sporulation protein D n=1 Tax=Candidatus Termititenax persephonae TaxID=2218525 RepID=A0A388TH96_9BACT|nr:stage V sporulation protein D [Candidatus Termititenax persephonae]
MIFYRTRWLSLGFGLFFLAALGRLFYLQVVSHQTYLALERKQIRKPIELTAKRGNITDRNGILLATTTEAKTVYVNHQEVRDFERTAEQLAAVLNMPPKIVYQKIDEPRYFGLLQRRISDAEAQKLQELKIPGVHLIDDQKRLYLRGNLAANTIGFVNVENQGAAGLELTLEKYLQGIAGRLIIESDPFGQEIHAGERILQEPRDGDNVQLTIDEFLQYTARKHLAAALQKNQADRGCVLILDTASGEILALVSLPDFDPNRYGHYPPENMRNNAVQLNYEPGSVFKVITVAAALELGLVSTNTTFINGNTYEHAGHIIRESHPLKDPERPRTVKDIISESLNISSAQLALRIGKTRFANYLQKFRFGRRLNIFLPGEEIGLLKPLEQIGRHEEAVYGFGQAFAVTPLQMLAAFNVIANDGIYVKPRLVQRITDHQGKIIQDFRPQPEKQKVLSSHAAREIRLMLQECVQKGTGTLAAIPGYSIGGKTGTSQKARPGGGGYLPQDYISSFAGIVPGNRPRLTILVLIDNPRGDLRRTGGGDVAAPVFQEIAKEAVRYLAIPEDI